MQSPRSQGNKHRTGAQRFSRYIFQGGSADKNNNVLAYTKNTILIILLCLTVYYISRLTNDFVNTILLGFLGGVAYRQIRQKFIIFWKKQSKKQKQINGSTILRVTFDLVLFFLLPWLYALNNKSFQEYTTFSFKQVINCFVGQTSIFIRISQIYFFINALYSLFANFINRHLFFTNMSKRTQNVLSIILGLSLVIIGIAFFVLFILTIILQIRNAGIFAMNTVEKAYQCNFFADDNSLVSHCKDKIPSNLKEFIPKINNEEAIQNCMKTIKELQTKFFKYQILFVQQQICTAIGVIEQISPNILQNINITTTSHLFTFLFNSLGAIFKIFIIFSNSVFSLTTWFAIFFITIQYYEVAHKNLNIFGRGKQQLVDQISSIISASFSIAFEHLLFSVVLLQIFKFTSINIFISLILSMIAFIPYVKPSFIMIIICLIKIAITKQYFSTILCGIIYIYVSQKIYSRHYKGVNMHKVLINLSVVFGIYQFGVSGILYGPLLIVLFQCVYEQLFI